MCFPVLSSSNVTNNALKFFWRLANFDDFGKNVKIRFEMGSWRENQYQPWEAMILIFSENVRSLRLWRKVWTTLSRSLLAGTWSNASKLLRESLLIPHSWHNPLISIFSLRLPLCGANALDRAPGSIFGVDFGSFAKFVKVCVCAKTFSFDCWGVIDSKSWHKALKYLFEWSLDQYVHYNPLILILCARSQPTFLLIEISTAPEGFLLV